MFSKNQLNFFSLTFYNCLRIGVLGNCCFMEACANSEEKGSEETSFKNSKGEINEQKQVALKRLSSEN